MSSEERRGTVRKHTFLRIIIKRTEDIQLFVRALEIGRNYVPLRTDCKRELNRRVVTQFAHNLIAVPAEGVPPLTSVT
jgi:hypothetical protein